MDGIAIRYETFLIEDNKFPVEAVAAAGAPQQKLKNPLNCIEVMTGAMLPLNTDTVIPYEQN